MGDTGWAELKNNLTKSTNKIRAFYLAVAPNLFGTICEKIAANGLITSDTRLVVEKPLGHDGGVGAANQ